LATTSYEDVFRNCRGVVNFIMYVRFLVVLHVAFTLLVTFYKPLIACAFRETGWR